MNQSPTPLPDLWSAYLNWRTTELLSEHTLARLQIEYAKVAELLRRHVGQDPTSADLTAENLIDVFAHYSSERVVKKRGGGTARRSPGVVYGCISTWSRFCDYLVPKHLAGNPMSAISRPKVPKRLPKPIQGGTETVQILLDSIGRGDRLRAHPRLSEVWWERDLALVLTYLTTGLRQQELAAVMLAEIDVRPGNTQVKVVGKGSKERWVQILDEVMLVNAAYLETRKKRFPAKGADFPPDALLMVNDRGGRLTPGQIRYIVEECLSAAGVRGSVPTGALVHALRHTYATDLANSGAAATTIQKAMGHGSLATSQLYIEVTDSAVRKAVEESGIAGLLAPKDTAA